MPSPTDRNLTALPTKTAKLPARRQARHFTQLDQVTQLVAARDADPELGFMARLLALCSLPRTNPGDQHEFKRVNGPYTLYMTAGAGNKLPYGSRPRLLLAWVCSEAVRTQSRELILGDSLSEFMRRLGIYSTSGDKHTRLRNQIKRLFYSQIALVYKDAHGERSRRRSGAVLHPERVHRRRRVVRRGSDQFLLSTSRIWFARMGVRLGLTRRQSRAARGRACARREGGLWSRHPPDAHRARPRR